MLIAVDLVRAAAQVSTGVLVLVGAAPIIVYVILAFGGAVGTAYSPAKSALLPSLVTSPDQLTAANAIGGTIESIGPTVGPALGALLLAGSSIQVVMFAFGGVALWSAWMVSRLGTGRRAADKVGEVGQSIGNGGDNEEARLTLRRALDGFRTIGADPSLRLMVGVFAIQMLAFGLMNVFVVSLALHDLRIGPSGVGWLTTAAGIGGIVGGFLTVNLAGHRLVGALAGGMILMGGAFALGGAVAVTAVELVAFCVMNTGGMYVDIATFTLLQRSVDEAVLARAFSVIETIIIGALVAGGALGPLMIRTFGVRGAMIVIGAASLATIALTWRPLRRRDLASNPPVAGLSLLQGLPLFAALPVAQREQLAARLSERIVADGETIVTQGEDGDAYYVIADGEVEVRVDSQPITTLATGDGFGEIALLLNTPRTATVVANGPVRLAVLRRDDFLATVSGHAGARRTGDQIVTMLLDRARPSAFVR